MLIMLKKEFKESLFAIFDAQVDGLTYDEKINYVEKLLLDYQKEHENKRDTSNKGKPWTDDELRIILADTPSKYNCLKFAKLFKRGYGSIEQIYRWAATTDEAVRQKRPDDKYIQQIKRIAKELGLCC